MRLVGRGCDGRPAMQSIRLESGGTRPVPVVPRPCQHTTTLPNGIRWTTAMSARLADLLGSRLESVTLTPQEVARYSRHLIMPEVAMEGQKRLKAASILLIGAGGLGSPLGLYLAAAGIGRIGLVDFDVVDFSNLQRQVLHGTADVGRPKLHSARDRLHAINPEVQLDLHETRLTAANALALFEPYDIVIDGTDNFPT